MIEYHNCHSLLILLLLLVMWCRVGILTKYFCYSIIMMSCFGEHHNILFVYVYSSSIWESIETFVQAAVGAQTEEELDSLLSLKNQTVSYSSIFLSFEHQITVLILSKCHDVE